MRYRVEYQFPSQTNATLFWAVMQRLGFEHLVTQDADRATVDHGPLRGTQAGWAVDDHLLSYGAYVVRRDPPG